jgi:hypothetical protein
MACCDVCAYSLNVSHLVVTQASRLAVRCPGAPTHEVSYCLLPPHVVTSEKPVKFPALYRLIHSVLWTNDHMCLFRPACLSVPYYSSPSRGVTVPLQATACQ